MNFWKNKRILITGGTSGLGKALATQLSQREAKVAIVARERQGLDTMAEKHHVLPIQADLSNKKDIHRIAGEVSGQLGGVDILFNNASYLGATPLQLLLDTECEDLEHLLQTNLLGPFRLTKALLPGMILRGNGTIVNISSDAAVSAYATWGGYGISKAALDHMTQIWAEELAGQGIRFLAIDPGDMHTPMHLAAIPDANVEQLYQPEDVAKDMLNFLAQVHPSGRYEAQQWRSKN